MKTEIYTTCQDCHYCKLYPEPHYVCDMCGSVNVTNVDKNMDEKIDNSPLYDAT